MRRKRYRRQGRPRRALAVVELAVCLPMIVVLVFGAIEACTMIFVKQSLHVTAYEGVRQAVKGNATNTVVLRRCNQVLSEREVNSAAIELIPANVEDAERGEDVVVRITAPVRDNTILGLKFFRGNLQVSATMVKE